MTTDNTLHDVAVNNGKIAKIPKPLAKRRNDQPHGLGLHQITRMAELTQDRIRRPEGWHAAFQGTELSDGVAVEFDIDQLRKEARLRNQYENTECLRMNLRTTCDRVARALGYNTDINHRTWITRSQVDHERHVIVVWYDVHDDA